MDTIYYEIKKENSKYNKYLKWHVTMYNVDKSTLSSMYFKTKKDAENDVNNLIDRGKHGVKIGKNTAFYEYINLEEVQQ